MLILVFYLQSEVNSYQQIRLWELTDGPALQCDLQNNSENNSGTDGNLMGTECSGPGRKDLMP